jgi:hypothetical protein
MGKYNKLQNICKVYVQYGAKFRSSKTRALLIMYASRNTATTPEMYNNLNSVLNFGSVWMICTNSSHETQVQNQRNYPHVIYIF